MEESTARTVIKILAVLSFIGSAICLLLAGLFAFAGSMAATGAIPELASLGASAGLVLGGIAFLFVLAAIYDLFVGIGLWRFRNWGRILFLVSAWIGIPFTLIVLYDAATSGDVAGIVGQAVALFIAIVLIWFFQFNAVVRPIFSGVTAAATSESTPAVAPAETMMLAPTDAAPIGAEPASTVIDPAVVAPKTVKAKRAPAKKAGKKAKVTAKKGAKKSPKKAATKKKK